MARTGGIYGLSGSGMDVDEMVKKMMQAQQARYDKMYQSKVKAEWQKSAYNDFYKSMTTFKYGVLGDFKLQKNLSPKSASISDDSIISASVPADAVEMTHKITVSKKASNAYLQSSQEITRMNKDGAVDPDSSSIYLRDLMGSAMPEAPAIPDVPTKPEEPDPATATAEELAQYQTDLAQYNADKQNYDDVLRPEYEQKYEAYQQELDKTAFSFQFSDGSKDENGNEIKKVLTFTYRDLQEQTLNDFAGRINDLGLNLQASYDMENDSFSISQKKGGENNKINIGVYTGGIKDESGNEIPGLGTDADAIQRTRNVFNSLHLSEFDSENDALKPQLQMDGTAGDAFSVQGTSAEVKIDGREYKSDTNKITVGGVEYTLKEVGSAQATITGDTDKVVDNVKKFIEEYNKMIDSMNNELYEKAYSDYGPLTEDQKKAMSKEEIEKWEEKAKSGLLYRDDILRDVVSDMRSALSRPINSISSKYNSAANIGITTSSDWTKRGHLELGDEGEKKLREALAADPDAVYKIFMGDPDSDDPSDQGIAVRLTSVMEKGEKKIKERAGLDATAEDQSTLGITIASIQQKMKAFQTQMDEYQARLYKQFNAMETAIASLNSQYNFVTSYTSGS